MVTKRVKKYEKMMTHHYTLDGAMEYEDFWQQVVPI